MNIRTAACAFLTIGLIYGFAPASIAEPVRNGNELALAWSTNSAAGRKVMQKQAAGIIHTFRYLKVTAVSNDEPGKGAMTVMTVEPSSELEIALIVTKPYSLELAATLTTNDSVSAYGRIKSIGRGDPDKIVVDPAILKHKDRAAPKLTKELLHEVDPAAR